MKLQKQAFKHDPVNGVFGDCHRTAIAMILNMDRDEVPHFMDGVEVGLPEEHEKVVAMRKAIEDFLAARGLAEAHCALDGSLTLEKILELSLSWFKGPVILGGTSTTGVNHSVVVFKGEIYNPSEAEIIGPCDDGYWWFTALAVGENWKEETK